MTLHAYLENADTHNLVCSPPAGIWEEAGVGMGVEEASSQRVCL